MISTDVPPGAAIEFSGVTKRFDADSPPALNGIDLRINGGELVTFVGPSGCGKTTMLRLINRLIEPTSGQVTVDGQNVSNVAVEQLRRNIGYVIQHVGLFPHRSVADNIATVPKLLRWPKSQIRSRVEELADLVGLDASLLSRFPSALSGGQQQRVGVARALAARPAVLLMDEPYSAIDPVVRARLQQELLKLHGQLPTTIVLVTHDIDEAITLGDRVAVFEAGGTLAQFATPAELLAHPANDGVRSFLGEDRALKRMSLATVASLPVEPLPSDWPTFASPTVEIDIHTNARSAIDLMLAAGVAHAVVTADGAPIGLLPFTKMAAP